jgi:cytoskeletal protein CcmA (bactofilin family)
MFSNKTETKVTKIDSMPSIISESLTIEGNLISEGEVQIDGTVNGDVTAANLTVGQSAVINGEIDASVLTIRGFVDGRIKGEEISIMSTATVKGDVIHTSLSIEPGAKIDGHLQHNDNPRDLPQTVSYLDKAEANGTDS